jgi:hypothetical protein
MDCLPPRDGTSCWLSKVAKLDQNSKEGAKLMKKYEKILKSKD